MVIDAPDLGAARRLYRILGSHVPGSFLDGDEFFVCSADEGCLSAKLLDTEEVHPTGGIKGVLVTMEEVVLVYHGGNLGVAESVVGVDDRE